MAVDITAGRLALWRFQNGSLLDSSGNNRNLTMVGTVTPAIDKDGIANNAMSFAGAGNYLEVPFTLSPVNPAISLWWKKVIGSDGLETDNFAVGIRRQDNPGRGFAVTFLGHDSPINVYVKKQDSDNITSYEDSNVSGWVHYFACYINDRFRLYRNGVKVGETVSTLGEYSSTVNKISIGKVFDYNRDSNDLMDEISIYDLPTGTNTDALALEIYNMGVNYEIDTLAVGRIAWWRFNNGDLRDQSGNGRTLTPVGTVNFVPDKDGVANNAISFSGTGNSLECDYSDSPQNPYISAWVKCTTPNTGTEFLVVIRGIDQGWQGFSLLLRDGSVGWSTYLEYQREQGVHNIQDGNWHHAFLQYEKSTGKLRLYVDGILRGIQTVSTNTSITYNTSINKIQFGTASVYPYESNDMLDEVMVGDRVLTGQVDTIGAVATGEIANLLARGVNYSTTPLSFNIINVFDISGTSVKLRINCNDNATAYYKLYNKNEIAPTSEQLRTNYDGKITLTANVLSTTNIVGLTSNSDYDLYVVAEDASTAKNIQIVPTKISFFTMTKGTPNAGQSGTLANGLLTHWCFTDGSLADISGNGKNLVGGTTFGTDKDGNSNCALLKTGQTTNITAIDDTSLCCKTDWTISFFIKFNNNNVDMVPIGQGNYHVSGSYFERTSDGKLVYGFQYSGGDSSIISSSMDWTIWRNVIVKINSSKIAEMYIDNVLMGTKDLSSYSFSNYYRLFIGYYYPSNNYLPFSGSIDEIRIYNRALTSNEIAEINMMGANYEADITPPTFNTINISDTSHISTKLNINCNEDATAYYKILKPSDTEPTPLQLRNSHDGIINLTANTTIQTIVSLNEDQNYKLVVVAEDLHNNLQNNITTIALDIAPPIFNTINISNITYNSIKVNINCNEDAMVYLKISSRNEPSPSSIELKKYVMLGVSANTLCDIGLGGLLELTEYSLYAVAEDLFGNLQTSPTRIDFSTIKNDKDIRLNLGMFSDVLSPAYYNGFFQSLKEKGFTSKNEDLIFLNPNVLPKIYEYGIEKNGETITYNLQIPILPQEEKTIWIENYISPTSDNFNFSGAVADLDKYYGKYNSIQYAKEFKDINNMDDKPYPFLLITDRVYNDSNGDIIYKDFNNSNIEFSFLPSDKEEYKSKIIIKNTLPNDYTKSEISVSNVIASTLEISIKDFNNIKIGNVIKLKEIKNMSDPFYDIYKSNYDVKYKIINKYIDTKENKFYITLDKVYPFYKYNNSYIACELFDQNIILLNYLSIRGNPIIFKTGEYEIKDTGSIDRYGDKVYKIQSSLFPLSYYERLGKTIVSERKSVNKISDLQYEYKKEYTKFIAEFNLEHYLLNIGDLIHITEDYYYNIINEPFQIISIKRSANGSERGSKIVALSCRLLKDNTYNTVFKEVEASNIKSISSLDPTDYLTDKNILSTRYITQFGGAYNSIGKTARVISKIDKVVMFNVSDFTNIDTSNIVFAINDIYYQTTLVEQDSQYLSFLLINDKVENIDSVKVNDIAYIYQNELTVNKSYTVSEYQSSRTSHKLYFSYSLKDIYDSIIVRIYESNTYESATMFDNEPEPTLILQTQTREDKFLIGNSENCNLKYDIKYDKYYTIHLTIVSLQEDLYPQEKITVYTPTNSYTIDYKGGA